VSTCLTIDQQLMPARNKAHYILAEWEGEFTGQIKIGRIHLMDAMLISFSQQLSDWRAQLELFQQGIGDSRKRLSQIV
jgi:fumarate hydratase class II